MRVARVEPKKFEFVIRAHGTVTPRTESTVVPQVSGPVVWASPVFASGGFFEENEPLVRIERADYEAALESAQCGDRPQRERIRARPQGFEAPEAARQPERRERLALRRGRQRRTNREGFPARGQGNARPSRARPRPYRDPRAVHRAGARRERRCRPVRHTRHGDRQDLRSRLRGSEAPIPDSELSFVDLPMLYRGQADDGVGPEVDCAHNSRAATKLERRIVRTEGEIDARSRMVNVVARVEDPYGHDPDTDTRERPPLAVGLFVEAEIRGRSIEDAVILPRSVLRTGDQVLVVDGDGRISTAAITPPFLPRLDLRVADDLLVLEDLFPGLDLLGSSFRSTITFSISSKNTAPPSKGE